MSSSSSDSDADSGKEAASPVPDEPTRDSDSAPSHRSASPIGSPKAHSGSESEESVHAAHNKRRVMDSDDEGEPAAVDATASQDVFGEDVSSSDGERKEGAGADRNEEDSDNDGSVTGIRMYPAEEEEEPQDEEVAPVNIEAEAPAVDIDISGNQPYFVRLPNFLSIAKKPFDAEYYEEDEEEDSTDAEGRARLKLRVENTIRWRAGVDEQGQEVKESNAKMVRWSDGTMSMYLGNEIFDVQTLPVHDHNHLFIRQGLGLMGQAVFTEKIHLRPHSTDSHTHRKVTMSMADRTRKSGQVKIISQVGKNPDEERRESMRKAEEELRAAYRRETAQRRTRDKKYGLSSSFLEGRDEGSDEESLNAIKRAYQKGGRYDAPLIGASDSETDDEDAQKRLKEAQKDSDASSDEELGRKKLKAKKIVTSDEESD